MKLLRNKNPKTARTIQLSEELGPHLDQRKRSINGKFLDNIKKKKKKKSPGRCHPSEALTNMISVSTGHCCHHSFST